MPVYTIVVTAHHDAVDYDKYILKGGEHYFDVFTEAPIEDGALRTMVFVPREGSTALDLFDLTRWLDSNSPRITTYVICR